MFLTTRTKCMITISWGIETIYVRRVVNNLTAITSYIRKVCFRLNLISRTIEANKLKIVRLNKGSKLKHRLIAIFMTKSRQIRNNVC